MKLSAVRKMNDEGSGSFETSVDLVGDEKAHSVAEAVSLYLCPDRYNSTDLLSLSKLNFMIQFRIEWGKMWITRKS